MNVCRTCLTVAVAKDISLLPEKLEGEPQSYSDIMLFCLGIKVVPESKLTTKLCVDCFLNILSIHKFKTQAVKSDEYLRSLQEKVKDEEDVKKEDTINFFDDDEIREDYDIKVEVKADDGVEELQSDDELLSVIKNIKHENLNEESKENVKSDEYLRSLQEKVKDEEDVKKEDTINFFDDDEIREDYDIKVEVKADDGVEELQSDDELLSVIKNIKHENLNEESKENEHTTVTKGKKSKKKAKKESEKQEQVCEECGKTVRNLKVHMYQHKPLLMRKRYKCKSCDKMFSTFSSRRKHYKIKHLGIKQHCNECNKDVVNLTSHCMVVHNSKPLPFECVPCGRRFLSKSKRDQHMVIHTTDRPYKCDQCDKDFRSKTGLTKHKRQVHDKEKSHFCQFCSKGFFKKYNLQVHIRSHSKERPYECPDCGKHFTTTATLKNHRLIHSDFKMFACERCDMTFYTSGSLRNHMVCHTKEKRYSCKYCGTPFGRSDHRRRHERTAHERVCHTKEKRYSCKYCGTPFGRSDHRRRHERTAHERLLTAA